MRMSICSFLSIYNRYKNRGFSHSNATLPNEKLRPQSAPFKFTKESLYNRSIRRDKREELAEIEILKTTLEKIIFSSKLKLLKEQIKWYQKMNLTKKEKYSYPDDILWKIHL